MFEEKCEVWKDIEGYEGLYQVSNMGRVRSLDHKDKYGRFTKGRVLTDRSNSHGYCMDALYRDGNAKNWQVHRLVAMTFLENSDNLPEINHKDEDKTNNAVSNLEWCSHDYNTNYGTRNERIAKAGGRPVYVVSESGHRYFFSSITKAVEILVLSFGAVAECLNGKRKHHHGFSFERAV